MVVCPRLTALVQISFEAKQFANLYLSSLNMAHCKPFLSYLSAWTQVLLSFLYNMPISCFPFFEANGRQQVHKKFLPSFVLTLG